MKLEVSYITNTGKLRYRNEDSLLIVDKVISGISMSEPSFDEFNLSGQLAFAVADGMGGLPCGDVASRLALEFLKDKKISSREEIAELLLQAKSYIDYYVKREGVCVGMGTAVAGLFIEKGRTFVFNVGDCRVYRKRNYLERLTKDHTQAHELYEKGFIDEEDIRHHPFRNMLTSALIGGNPEEIKIHTVEMDIQRDDVFLVCSDGLWDELSFEEIDACLSYRFREAGKYLFERAYKGGRDNISFILIKVL